MGDVSIDEVVKNINFLDSMIKPYIKHELNTDKIENLDDCKKILKFLCNLTMKPLQNGVEYCGFRDVKQFFY